MEEILKNITMEDLEKFKALFSIMPGNVPKEIVTLRVFVEEYSSFIKQNRSKAYHVSVISSFKHLAEFFCTQKSINELGLKEMENFCSYLQQNISKGFRVYYRTLKAAFNKAKEWGYIRENFFTKVKLPKRQKLAPVFINYDQLSAISSQIKNEIVRDVFVFAFYTGLRLDEIVNLRWKNIDLARRIITVGDEVFTTKGRKQRYIPICEEALEALLRMKSVETAPNMAGKLLKQWGGNSTVRTGSPQATLSMTNGFVFCKVNGEKYTGDYISQCFKRACKAINLDIRIHFHSLRHSFASNLVQKGVPLYTIKELLGHSSIATTEIYSHLNVETLRDAIGKLDSLHPALLPKGEVVKQPQIYRINEGK